MNNQELASELRKLAEDNDLLWAVPRAAIEDALIEFRDSRISLIGRGNGLVVREKDTSPSAVIRMGPEMAVSIGLKALADYLDKENND